jgi:hypothetical protein
MAAAGLTYTDNPQDPSYAALFHPKSFASHFPFNTNIWAAKHRQLQVAGQDMAANTEFFPYYYRASEQWFPLSATSDKHAHGLPWVGHPHDAGRVIYIQLQISTLALIQISSLGTRKYSSIQICHAVQSCHDVVWYQQQQVCL